MMGLRPAENFALATGKSSFAPLRVGPPRDGPVARFEQKSLPAWREGCDYLDIQNDQTLARSSKPFLTIFVCFINFIAAQK